MNVSGDVIIARPSVPKHFMVLRPIKKRIIIRLPDGELLADSVDAMRLIESGKTIYDPVCYLPKSDVVTTLQQQDKKTHCPLKGDASYFRYVSFNLTIDDLAWSYEEPLPFSLAIKGLIAFYDSKVVIEEHPF